MALNISKSGHSSHSWIFIWIFKSGRSPDDLFDQNSSEFEVFPTHPQPGDKVAALESLSRPLIGVTGGDRSGLLGPKNLNLRWWRRPGLHRHLIQHITQIKFLHILFLLLFLLVILNIKIGLDIQQFHEHHM